MTHKTFTRILLFNILISIYSSAGAVDFEYDSRLNTLTFGVIQEIENNSLVNLNNQLGISQHRAEINLRPDFSINTNNFEVGFKPRINFLQKESTESSTDKQAKSDVDAFVNEWLIRYKLSPQLFISYGRENLQWGPSSLVSVSTPFNKNNGRDNPRLEISGLDYAKTTWIPNNRWSVSLIANTHEGRQKSPDKFNETYAAKIDYIGNKFYASLIPSHKEGEKDRLGWYLNNSVTDALLLHAEGSLLGTKEDRSLLVGGSYTFENGGTISLEYLNQQDGCDLSDFHLCLSSISPINNRKFLREKYAFLQYNKSNIGDIFDLTLRATHGLDDSSSRITTLLKYGLNDNAQLFFVGDVYSGDSNSEFGSLLNYAGMFGIEYTF